MHHSYFKLSFFYAELCIVTKKDPENKPNWSISKYKFLTFVFTMYLSFDFLPAMAF